MINWNYQIPENAPLRKNQHDAMDKHCKKCGVSLSILSRGIYCPDCKIAAKKERNQKRKLTSL